MDDVVSLKELGCLCSQTQVPFPIVLSHRPLSPEPVS